MNNFSKAQKICIECFGPGANLYNGKCNCYEDNPHNAILSNNVCSCKPGFLLNEFGNNCIKCFGPSAILVDNYCKCDSESTEFNRETRNCDCTNTHQFYEEKNSCIKCPIELSAGLCICPENSILSNDSTECLPCAEKQFYGMYGNQCIWCGSKTNNISAG
jgi:hypothetical protein